MSFEHFINQLLHGKSLIILLGAGGLLPYAISELKKLDIEAAYISDNNKNLHGTKTNDIEIIPPNKIKKKGFRIICLNHILWHYGISTKNKSIGLSSISYIIER